MFIMKVILFRLETIYLNCSEMGTKLKDEQQNNRRLF